MGILASEFHLTLPLHLKQSAYDGCVGLKGNVVLRLLHLSRRNPACTAMKIERIELHQLNGKVAAPYKSSMQWKTHRGTVAVRVVADDGTYGWGETGGDASAIAGIAASVIGKNPAHFGSIWQSIINPRYQSGGYGGLASKTASAIDIALHDLVGKSRGVPVYELLGGKVRDRICAYATGLFYTEDDLNDPTWSGFLDEAQGYVEAGFVGMKMKIGGFTFSEDVDRVGALRRKVGDGVRIMVDANEAYDPMTAISMARSIADFDVTWFEEPTCSRSLEDNLLITSRSPVPTAGGESASTRRDVARLLGRRIFDMIQPEVVNVGGISELKLCADMSEAFNIRFFPHFFNTHISLAAILHTLATISQAPPAHPKEPFVNEPVTEFDQTSHPVREELTDPFFQLSNGCIDVPEAPGLGIEVNEDALDHFRQGDVIVVD